ncbi:MAG: glycosyltransferase family 39 protein [Chloroflexi bacterium]|nr:glycosyltransferase family 39 protein [Chloroflexota bacterium]
MALDKALRARLPLALILLAGAALRLFRLGADSLWYDETVSTYLAGSPLPELIRHTAGDIHPPGYYVLLRGWLILAGYPTGHADPSGIGLEFTAGFFSLFFGVLLIALVYALAQRVADRRIALIAAALVALSPYNVWYSQEVRMYTLGAGLGVVALYALLRATRAGQNEKRKTKVANRQIANPQSAIHNPQFKWWLVYALAAAAGMYTLYYFAFLLVPLNLWMLVVLARRRTDDGRPTTNDEGRTTKDERRNTQCAIRNTNHASRITFHVLPLLLANLAAALLYAPWIPVAYRQAIDPPVPPWRTAPDVLAALAESWTTLSLGQSAPVWLWPVLFLTLVLYGLGVVALANRNTQYAIRNTQYVSRFTHHVSRITSLPLATFGPLALILLVSAVTPLYHVRYLFTYSPAFYVVLAAGFAWPWRKRITLYDPLPTSRNRLKPLVRSRGTFFRADVHAARSATAHENGPRINTDGRGSFPLSVFIRVHPRPILRAVAVGAAVIWLAASALTLRAFWFDPLYRGDDHRAAVRFLQERWRPGDVVLVNAGWPYTALTTYWNGPITFRGRLTDALPAPRADAGLVVVTTGHVDGDAGLGWADPRSDFFALPADVAERQIAGLFERFPRVWQYRIYDTVNDPAGKLRGWLAEDGQLVEDRVFAGEANMRVQALVPRRGVAWPPDLPTYRYAAGVSVQFDPAAVAVESGGTLYGSLTWRADAAAATPFASSLRLIGGDGDTWAQPPDERPLGSQFGPGEWPVGVPQHQPFAVRIPAGTPPGEYTLALLVYDPATGAPWPPQDYRERLVAVRDGLNLSRVTVVRSHADARAPLARFGSLALVSATSPATTVAPGGKVPVELLWQAASAPGEPLVVVVQLLGSGDRLAANLEEQPMHGHYPTERWAAGELVADRHTVGLPPDIPPGEYRLIVGVYRAADRTRLKTQAGPFTERDYWVVKRVMVRSGGG